MQKLSIKKPLGKTGIDIPPIIFGTSALGNLYEALDVKTKLEIVSEPFKYVQAPVVFDSAGKYGAGLSLEMLGKCLNELKINPDQVIISNKLGWLRKPLTTAEPTFEQGVWFDINHDAVQKISYDGMMQCWQEGNELLNGFAPQLLSVHDPDEYLMGSGDSNEMNIRYDHILDAYEALAELKAKGLVKAVGIGAKNWRTIEMISKDVELDWVMFANSLTVYRHPVELVEFMSHLHSKGVGIINSAVFNAGFLIGGKYFDYTVIKPDTPENKQIFEWREKFLSLCRKHDLKPADVCVQFGLSVPGVSGISLNTSSPYRIKENVASVTTEISDRFWIEMKDKELISKDYPFVG